MKQALFASRSFSSSAIIGRLKTGWFNEKSDKLTHVLLSGISLYLAARLVSQAHKAEETEVMLQAQLDNERKRLLLRRRAMLEQAPELARQAGLHRDGVLKLEESLKNLDKQLEEVWVKRMPRRWNEHEYLAVRPHPHD